jgi:hypothetical protein
VDCVVAVKVKARRGRGLRRAGLRHGRRVKGCLRLTKAGTPLWCLRARGEQGRMTRRAGLRHGLAARRGLPQADLDGGAAVEGKSANEVGDGDGGGCGEVRRAGEGEAERGAVSRAARCGLPLADVCGRVAVAGEPELRCGDWRPS